MKFKTLLAAFLCLGSVSTLFAQLDLKDKAQLVGIQVDERQSDKPEIRKTDISFIFTGKPTQYFHIFKDSILEIQFYDAVLGDEKLPEIAQSPFIAGGSIAVERLNVNKDIEGLSALYKDVVKVQLPIEKKVSFDFSMADDFNVITLATVWSRTKSVGGQLTTQQGRKKTILIGSVVGVTVGAVAAIFLLDKGKDVPPEPTWDPDPPTLPTPGRP